MEPETNLLDLTEDLEATIDDLSSALTPLLSTPLSTHTSTLPTLDKAKLHILTAYTLESLLFSALQASGADAKAHKIFPELARLKTYFGKVKEAEAAGEGKGGPTTRLDKEAAGRFIRHGLSGNERYDKERAERVAKEKARAALKARQMGAASAVNKKFDDGEETRVQEELGRKRKAEEAGDENSDSESEGELLTGLEESEPARKADADVEMGGGSEEDHVASEDAEFYGDAKHSPVPSKSSSKPEKKDKKSSKRRKSTNLAPDSSDPNSNSPAPSRRKTKDRGIKKPHSVKKEQEFILPERGDAPRTHSETFNALLSGSFAEQKRDKKKSKKAKKA